MAEPALNPIAINVVRAGEGPTRTIKQGEPCRICPEPILPGQAVVRLRDFDAGPGVREHCVHKSCLQLLLDCTVDDDDHEPQPQVDPYRQLVERYANIAN